MCEILMIAMYLVWLIETNCTDSAVLIASVGFAIAGGLYRIGRGIETRLVKKTIANHIQIIN